jgi:hypothetical protein
LLSSNSAFSRVAWLLSWCTYCSMSEEVDMSPACWLCRYVRSQRGSDPSQPVAGCWLCLLLLERLAAAVLLLLMWAC